MIIGITNIKGGVGKSTLSQNLAAVLAQNESSVQIIDTDANQNSIDWAASRDEDLPNILAVGCQNPKMISKIARAANKNYDYVVIDGSPGMSDLNTRLMVVSDILLIPITPSVQDVRAFQQFAERLEQVRDIKEASNHTLNAFIIMNLYAGYSIEKDLLEALKQYEIPIFENTISKRTAYVQSALNGSGIVEWNDQKAIAEFMKVANEFIANADELGFLK